MKLQQLKENSAEYTFADEMEKQGQRKMVDADHDYHVQNKGITSLVGAEHIKPVNSFDCSRNKLKNLIGSPRRVDGSFICTHMADLKSLIGAPVSVGGEFVCTLSGVESLEGSPKTIGINFECDKTKIKDLKGSPRHISGYLRASDCQLESLEGAPTFIGRNVNVMSNKLTNFKNVHKHFPSVGTATANGQMWIGGNPIKSHILGFILIHGLKFVDPKYNVSPLSAVEKMRMEMAFDIVNKYLGKGMAGVLDAQEELIDAKLEEFAQL